MPYFAGSVNIPFTRNQGRWSLHNELGMYFFANHGAVAHIQPPIERQTSVEFGAAFINFSNFIRYEMPIGKVGLFGQVGMTNGFAIRMVNERKVDSKFYNTETSKIYEAIPECGETQRRPQLFCGGTYLESEPGFPL